MAKQRVRSSSSEPLTKAADEAGLTDAWLTGKQDHLSFALLRPLPPVEQQRELLVAPNQGGY